MLILNLALYLLFAETSAQAREEMKVGALGIQERSRTILTKGHTYIITVKGTYSIWQSGCKDGSTPEGVDAYYCYLPARCKKPEVNKALVLGQGPRIHPMYDIAISNGQRVTYSKDHVYQLKLKGTDDPLRVSIQDTPSSDNCGELTITIEEAK